MKRLVPLALLPVLLFAGAARAQYPMVDLIANNLVEKYQYATCQQLWEDKEKPKTPQQMEALNMLRGDPQIRAYFINKVAGPVVNKMFECGMIP
jgi:hypothetical protein